MSAHGLSPVSEGARQMVWRVLRIRALPQRERWAGSRKTGQTPQPAQKLPPMQPLQTPERVPQALGTGWGTMMQLATLVHGPQHRLEILHPSPFPNFSPACYTQSYLVISPHTSLNQIGTIKQQLPRFLTSQVSTPFVPCLYVYLCVYLPLIYRDRHSPFSGRDQSLILTVMLHHIREDFIALLCAFAPCLQLLSGKSFP